MCTEYQLQDGLNEVYQMTAVDDRENVSGGLDDTGTGYIKKQSCPNDSDLFQYEKVNIGHFQ